MITDEERREVARRLREVNPYRNQSYTVPYNRYTPAAEYLSKLAGALGYSHKNDVSRLEFQSRLADLIEPSEPKVKCVAEIKIDGEQLEELVHDAAVELTGIDRDALLALADEMGRVRSRCDFCIKKGDCDWADETVCLESRIDDFAIRIREACGEVEPCDEQH